MANITLNVSNASQLASAIASATGGETIVLANGYYGALNISRDFASNVTIQSANQGAADFAIVDLSGASNVTMSGIEMTYGRATLNAANIAFENSVSTGGMYFRDVNGLTLEKNDISGGEHTLILNDIQNFVIRGNDIHDAESDLVRVTGASRFGLFENNFIHDVAATVPQHPDLIQLIGINGVNPTDITFTGNLLYDDPSTGDVYGQGLFISEPIGAGYSNILIENNMIMVGSPNSIYINGGQENIVIQNNTLVPWPGANGGVIRLTDKNGYDNRGVTVENNVARFLLDETGGSTIGENVIYNSSDPSFLLTLFQGLNGDWQAFLPVEGSIIDLANGMGAVDRLTELLNGDDGASTPLPSLTPTPTSSVSTPVENDIDYVIDDGATVFSLKSKIEVASSSDVLEIDLGIAGQVDGGEIAFSFNADRVNGQFGLISRDASGNGDHFTSFIKDGALNIRFQSASGEVYLTADNIAANSDYAVSVLFSENGIELSLNGTVVDTSDFSATMSNSDEMLQIGANGWASVSGAAGYSDVFDGTIWDATITSTDAANLISGSGIVQGSLEADMLSGDSTDDVLYGGSGADTLNGNGGDDMLNGDSATDILYGGEGDDTLAGGTGADTLNGGAGDDEMLGNTGVDLLNGGDGNDWMSTGDGVDVAYGDGGNDTIIGRTGWDTLHGGSGDDALYGSEGRDMLNGDDGNDWLSGGSGYDVLDGGDGNDQLYGNTGADVLSGGNGDDALFGATGDDMLIGGTGNDELYGAQGRDTLEGGAGDDFLRGGTLGDTFIFDIGHDQDTVSSFEKKDQLHLSTDLTGGLTEAYQIVTEFRTTIGGQVALVFNANDSIIFDTYVSNAELADSIFTF